MFRGLIYQRLIGSGHKSKVAPNLNVSCCGIFLHLFITNFLVHNCNRNCLGETSKLQGDFVLYSKLNSSDVATETQLSCGKMSRMAMGSNRF